MCKLLLTRRPGEAVRLESNGRFLYVTFPTVSYNNGVEFVLDFEGTQRTEVVRVGHDFELFKGTTIKVCEVKRGQAKLLFEAPAEVKILRTELT